MRVASHPVYLVILALPGLPAAIAWLAVRILVTVSADVKLAETFHIALDLTQAERIDSKLFGLECMEPLSTNPEILPKLLNKIALQLEEQQDCLLKRRALSVLANGLEMPTKSCKPCWSVSTNLPTKMPINPFKFLGALLG